MIKPGWMYTCDRCGKTKLYDSKETAWAEGWSQINNRELCVECSLEYKRIIDNFFNITRVKEES